MEDFYNPDFIKKIQQSKEEILNGNCKEIQTEII